MQGSFEKKVQEKMDELNLTPSAPVWEKIELEIKQEKKRRRGLLWIPLLVLLLAGTSWWLWEQRGEKGTDMSSATRPFASQEQRVNEGAVKNEKKEKASSGKKAEQHNQPIATNKYSQSSDRISTAFITPLAKRKKSEGRNQNKKTEIESVTHEKNNRQRIENLLNEKLPNLAIVENKSVVKVTASMPVDSVAKISAAPADTSSETKVLPLVITDSVAAKPKVAALPSKKWKVALSIQAGWSKPAPDQLSAIRDAAGTPTQSTGGGFSNNYAYPSRISRGTAFAAGIGLAKDIGRRWQVSIGLQYTVYRTHSRVGSFSPTDTTLRFQSRLLDVGGYYRNGNLQDYTTRTQVLELPVSLSYQVFSSLPLFLSAGGSYGRLLQSNALTYDRTSNVYYGNKQNLIRNQFAVFSSLQYGIINKKGFSLRAGPVVQYQLTSIQQETGTVSPRLLFGGLKTTVEF